MQKESLKFIEAVKSILDEYDFALTLRQIYYQLVARQIIPNEQKYYKKLSRLCVIGRDEGLLPEDLFTDRLRELDKPGSWADLSDFGETVKRAYKKDKWLNQDDYIEIWSEKDALRGIIGEITGMRDVGLLIVRGQVSRTAIYEAYQRYSKKAVDKNLYLFYFGDFDPSGLSIYNSLMERIRTFENGDLSIKFKRIALTPEQIKQYNLPQDPAKKTDPNYKKFIAEYGDNVVELDSLPPKALQEMIEGCITDRLNMQKFKQVQKTEREEKKELSDFINAL